MSHPYEDDINKMFDAICVRLGLVTEFDSIYEFEKDFYKDVYPDEEDDVTVVADVPYVEVIE